MYEMSEEGANLSKDISTLGSTDLSFPTDAGVISKP